VFIVLCARKDSVVGGDNCLFDGAGHRDNAVLALSRKQMKNFVHRHGACNLPSGGSTHSVAYNVDAIFDGKTKSILIGWALSAAV
jgi:hypothetical protein